MVFQCIKIRQVPWEVLKTVAFGLGFQHLPRDLANVNAWKTIFDPYIISRANAMIRLKLSRPRWLSWMRRPTGDQKVAGLTPAEVGNILSWRLIMKYFLRSFSPFRWFKKGSCQFLAKECAQYWLTA